MTRAILIAATALSLQGCILDKLDDPSKPSPSQQAMLDQQSLFSAPEVMTEVSVTECQEVFRVTKCINGEPRGWWS